MNIAAFRATLADPEPPHGLSAPLAALWHAGSGAWDRAHVLVQDADGGDGAWVHAYLHREEGDDANAAYWYRRAGRPVARGAVEAEWEAIVRTLLDGASG